MKKLSKVEMKTVQGGLGRIYYCRQDSDCPIVCQFGGPGPEAGYYCGGRVCQLELCW
jgi:hypothetical protein